MFVPVVKADPVAFWNTPWQVTLENPLLGGTTPQASRAFGAASTQDGQMTDLGVAGAALPDTDAVAKAEAVVGASDFGIIESAAVQVDFERLFTLPTSPGGFWNVTVSLTVAGTLSSTGSGIAGIRSLFKITDQSGNNIPGTGVSFNDSVSGTASRASTGSKSNTFILADGMYHATGLLLVSATNSSDPGSAKSNFFDTLDGMVTAAPLVPEPSAIIPASIGLIALAGCRWRHLRNSPQFPSTPSRKTCHV